MGTLGTSTPGEGLAATLALDPTPDCGLGKAHPRRGARSSVLPWLPGQRASGGSLGVAQTPREFAPLFPRRSVLSGGEKGL